MQMKAVAAALFLVAMSVCFSAYGEDPDVKPKTEGGVTFISGGVGMGQMAYLKKVEGDYNLRLLFAAKGTGEYFANVKVTIADMKGKAVLEVLSDGPRFMVRLPTGRYKVTAMHNGTPISRTVAIAGKRAVSLAFYWKAAYKEKPAG